MSQSDRVILAFISFFYLVSQISACMVMSPPENLTQIWSIIKLNTDLIRYLVVTSNENLQIKILFNIIEVLK